MPTHMFNPLRRLAYVVMLNLVLAQAALAAPASEESLKKFFQVNNVPDLVTRAVEAVGASKKKEWEDETDPKAKAEKKAKFEKLDAIIRKNITWEALQPVAIESYQRKLEEADVRALIAYAESPSGRVRVYKLAPAMIETLPQVFAYTDQRVDEISDRKEDTPPPARAAARPAAGSKEALALTMLTDLPGAREEYKLRMAGIEATMLKMAESLGLDNATTAAELKRSATRLQREITFEEIMALQAKLLADKLTEEEWKALINDNRQSALNQLLAKQKVADREFGVGANKYMAEKIMPGLMGEIMAALAPAETAKPAAKSSKKSASGTSKKVQK